MSILTQINTAVVDFSLTDMSYSRRSMARDSTGRIWVAYIGGGTGFLYAAYSDDGGTTWTEEAVWSDINAYGVLGTTLMIDSSNVPHIIWISDEAVNDIIRYTNRSGGVWAAPTSVYTFVGKSQYGLWACIDSSDDIHVLLEPNVTFTVSYLKRLSGVWQALETVNATGYPADICVDSTGDVYAVYGGTDGLWYLKVRNGLWGAAEQISTGFAGWPGNIVGVSTVIDSSDDFHVAYTIEHIEINDAVVYRKRDSGVWLAEQEIKVPDPLWSGAIENPILILDNAGLAFIVYQSGSGQPDEKVYYKTVANGTNVGPEVELADILRPGNHSSLYSGLWQLYPSTSVLPASLQVTVALLQEDAGPAYSLWFYSQNYVVPIVTPGTANLILTSFIPNVSLANTYILITRNIKKIPTNEVITVTVQSTVTESGDKAIPFQYVYHTLGTVPT